MAMRQHFMLVCFSNEMFTLCFKLLVMTMYLKFKGSSKIYLSYLSAWSR